MISGMTLSKDRYLVVIFSIFTFLMISLAIGGAFRSDPSVPFGDMWDGTLDFFIRINQGDYAAWWEQHNEHRILLARILFWIDIKWFGGGSVFLIVMNYVFVGLAALIFYNILREVRREKEITYSEITYSLVLVSWLFMWCQEGNFTWAFQSQFFLAQLLPLCAFYWLYKSSIKTTQKYSFLLACFFGAISSGTMANGVLVLPLMVVYAIVLRQGFIRSGILIVLSAIILGLYFHGYHSVNGHGSILNAIKENPFGLLSYVAIYIGSPFFYLLGIGNFGKNVSFIMGVFLIAASIIALYKSMQSPRKNNLNIFLLIFIIYIGGTAFGTAGGRLMFGLDQALSSRYTTPAVMAWAALFIIYSKNALQASLSQNKKYLVPLILISIMIFSSQLRALKSQSETNFERKIAALALVLQVHDKYQVDKIFPSLEYALLVTNKAVERKLSIFGIEPFVNMKQKLGSVVKNSLNSTCQGNLDEVSSIESEQNFVRVRGWIFNPETKYVPAVLLFKDSQGIIVGYAFTGKLRPDVAQNIGRESLQSGYLGYVLAHQAGAKLSIQGGEKGCQIQIAIPPSIVPWVKEEPSVNGTNVDAGKIKSLHHWNGADYQKSNFQGMSVFGSYVDSDANVGNISLMLNRGDKVFYRSGLTAGRQTLEVVGSGQPPIQLPASIEWGVLDFSSPALPKGAFIAKFSDNGTNFGEWSAIAIRKNDR